MQFDTLACVGCGISKQFTAGLRQPDQIYRCYDCFTKNRSNGKVDVFVEQGKVQQVEGPEWLKYKIIDLDCINTGDSDEFSDMEQAQNFMNSENEYHLFVVVEGGVAQETKVTPGLEVNIIDFDDCE